MLSPSSETVPAPAGRPLAAYPASFAQERAWLLQSLSPEDPAQNHVVAVRVEGPLNPAALERAFAAVAARHEALRTTFMVRGTSLLQTVHAPSQPAMAFEDLSGRAPTEAEPLARARIAELARESIDLENGPLARAVLLRIGAEEHVFALVVHQIIFDEWSAGIFSRELWGFYDTEAHGIPYAPAPLTVQCADYAAWERQQLTGPRLDPHLDWWRSQLAGAVPATDLPGHRDASAPEWLGGRHTFTLPPDVCDGLRALGQQAGATPFMTLLTLFQVLLARMAGSDDVVVGAPTAGRSRAEIENVIGFFVNLLPLRLSMADEPSFLEALRRTRRTALGGYAHQDIPFDLIVRALDPDRQPGQHPIFQVLFNFYNTPSEITTCGKSPPAEGTATAGHLLRARPFPVPRCSAAFDLSLGMGQSDGALWGEIEYRAGLLDARTAEDLAHRFLTLARSAIRAPDESVSRLCLLEPSERQLILEDWNATGSATTGQCIHELFLDRAARQPDTIAVVDGQQRLSYRELRTRAIGLAHQLTMLGAGPEHLVGLYVERSADMVVGMLAVLMSGAAYVPLDPSYPAAHLAQLAEEAGIGLILAHERTRGSLPATRARTLLIDGPARPPAADHPPVTDVTPENLAYAIHTSGSTGRPKRVQVPHRAAVSTYAGYARAYGLEEIPCAHLQAARISFDVCTGDLLRALLSGGHLVICPRDVLLDTGRLYDLLHREHIGFAELVPAIVRDLTTYAAATDGNLHDFKVAVVGSDAWFAAEFAATRRLLDPQARLINVFGITETAIDSTCHEITSDGMADGEVVPIGRPFINQKCHVLDQHGQPLPPGVAGELHIGGASVARGYGGRPDLTAERFVADPFSNAGERLYKTGDMARYRRDGTLEFLGRADHQLNLHGYRIEPGETEAALCAHPLVQAAAVAARPGPAGTLRLIAWYVPADNGQPPPPGDLRTHLQDRLPAQLVPARFVPVATLPLTANGKIDREALTEPDRDAEDADGRRDPPRTVAERAVAEIWREVLGAGTVGRDDDFFELGGHSLLATRVLSQLTARFGSAPPLRTIFEKPVLRDLAAVFEAGTTGETPPALSRVARDGPLPLSFAQRRIWFLQQLDPGSTEYNVPLGLRLRGQLDLAALTQALTETVARHEILRSVFSSRDGEPVQVIGAPGPVPLPVTQVDGEDAARREAAMLTAAAFDLGTGPPLRAQLLTLAQDHHILILVLHHIVSDEWSALNLISELADGYERIRHHQPALPPPSIQYADYSVWQRTWLTEERLDRQFPYWREQLADLPHLDLPSDRPRPTVRDPAGAVVGFTVGPEVTDRLREIGRAGQATAFMTLLAAFQLLLSLYSGQDDIPVASPVAGRTRPEIEPLAGFFVNTLILRGDLTGGPSFRDLVGRVRQVCVEAFARQDQPFEYLVERLAPQRDRSRHPLVQVNFTTLDGRRPAISAAGVSFQEFPVPCTTSKFDLRLVLTETDSGLAGDLEFATALFDRQRIQEMAQRFQLLLAAIADNPDHPVTDLGPFVPGETARLAGQTGPAAGAPVPELIMEQARAHPHWPAVADGQRSLSYGELETAVGRLAAHLRACGVGPDVVTGIALNRGCDLITALLAVWRAGGAYVMLEAADPPHRIEHQITAAGASIVITDPACADSLPTRVITVTMADAVGAPGAVGAVPGPAGRLAYIVFTSGTTGAPKAVGVSHASLAHYCQAVQRRLEPPPARTWALVSPLSVDLGMTTMLLALTSGGRLVLSDPQNFTGALAADRPDCLKITPTHLRLLLASPGGARGLPRELLILGGEPAPAAVLGALHDTGWGGRLYNHYGPAETTIGVAAGRYDGLSFPLGTALDGLACRLLDQHGRLVPPGVPGELYVGGPTLARGYLGRPGLTAERFIADPFTSDGGRMYRTGDLAVHRADGRLEFLGRADEQLNLNGYRVEPGEVETVLAQHPDVSAAAVDVRADHRGDPRLVAWICPAVPPGLGAFVAGQLPAQLRPAAYAAVDELPLSRSGKPDRHALVTPRPGQPGGQEAGGPPLTPTECCLADLWAELLDTRPPGRSDDFFELGGHSLAAIRLAGRIAAVLGTEIPLGTIFDAPALHAMAAAVDRCRGQAAAISRADRTGALRASFGQERLWFLNQLGSADTAHHIPVAIRLAGSLDHAALRSALTAVIARHEALRTTLEPVDGALTQVVHEPEPADLPVLQVDGEPGARKAIAREVARPFNLSAGPLIRAQLLALGPGDHVLSLVVHHIVFDGPSAGALIREIDAVYRDPGAHPPAATADYADYAAWQRAELGSTRLGSQLAYWRDRLAGLTPLDLPTDEPRPVTRRTDAATVPVTVPPELARELRKLAARHGATPFMVMLAAFALMLGRYAGTEDVAVGTPVSGRSRPELDAMIGFFVNTLVLRTSLAGDPTFTELLDRVRSSTARDLAHQDLPFEYLVEEVNPPRDTSHTPLFDVTLSFEEASAEDSRRFAVPCTSTMFDLTLNITDTGQGFEGSLEYRTDLFWPSTAGLMAEHLRVLLTEITRDPAQPISSLPLATAAETRRLQLLSRGPQPPHGPATVLYRIGEQVSRNPGAPAVRTPAGEITYGQLDATAGRVAAALCARGVSRGSVVGLTAIDGRDWITGILGILRAGAAYLPLSPALPATRQAALLDRANARILLTTDTSDLGWQGQRLSLCAAQDHPLPAPAAIATPDDVAYVIFTSGSTGQPKGVLVPHRALADSITARLAFYPDAPERFLLLSPFSFDSSVAGLFWVLCTGGTLVIPAADTVLDPAAILDQINREQITHLVAIQSLMSGIAQAAGRTPAPSLRTIVVAGETCPPPGPWRAALPGARFVNEYGVTEAAIWSTAIELTGTESRPSIGRPVSGVAAHVLGSTGARQPTGVPGELCLAGPLAQGYVRDPCATAERFVADPFAADGSRLYRTGDRVRWRPDGNLDFLGRADDQVKIRGHRIEPAETEAALLAHPRVRSAAVTARPGPGGELRLIAWVVPRDPAQAPGSAELRRYLADRLPQALVPDALMAVAALPRGPNGKVNRAALPEPEAPPAGRPPQTVTEISLARIWTEVLDAGAPGGDDDFFALGGNSLLASQMVSRVRETLEVPLPVRSVFDHPTLAGLAESVDALHWLISGDSPPGDDFEEVELA